MQNMDYFNGCVYLRNLLPSSELAKLGHEVELVILGTNFPIESLCKSDIVVLSRTYQTDVFPIVNALKKAKVKVVYETDDDLESLDTTNPTKAVIDRTLSTVKMLGYESDAITTTTPYLADVLEKRYGKKPFVIPNALDLRQYKVNTKGSPVIVGWSGGCTHAIDLLLILDSLMEIQKKTRFHFVLQGFTIAMLDGQEYVWRRMRELGLDVYEEKEYIMHCIEMCDKIKKMQSLQFVPFYPAEMFGGLLSKLNLDIGLCPLRDSVFNKAKSCVKYYEYAATGAATLASDVVPYNTEVKYLWNNTPEDFKAKLEQLVVDKAFRQNLAKEQRDWVIENRDSSKVAKQWEAMFKQVKES